LRGRPWWARAPISRISGYHVTNCGCLAVEVSRPRCSLRDELEALQRLAKTAAAHDIPTVAP
jgi:hypothetical protein